MNIIEENELFLVVQDGTIIFESKSLEEAQGFIDWKDRPDAGNTPEDCNCLNK
jgi:hypothetical protein